MPFGLVNKNFCNLNALSSDELLFQSHPRYVLPRLLNFRPNWPQNCNFWLIIGLLGRIYLHFCLAKWKHWDWNDMWWYGYVIRVDLPDFHWATVEFSPVSNNGPSMAITLFTIGQKISQQKQQVGKGLKVFFVLTLKSYEIKVQNCSDFSPPRLQLSFIFKKLHGVHHEILLMGR